MSALSLWVLLLSLFAPHEHDGKQYLDIQMSPAPPPASAPINPPDPQDGGSAIDPIG